MVYTNALLTTVSNSTNTTSIFSNDLGININSNEKIKEITVYDVLGKIIYNNTNINNTTFIINSISKNSQALFVKVSDYDNNITTKKLIF
ncbi:MAG: T9SS sorting signal type C domain-containing protein [Flavobacterium sp.]|nr:T9SS sorting signal type C domain-containing protein [Flavobacterium sp.]